MKIKTTGGAGGLDFRLPYPKILGAINKEKGSVRNCLRSHKCLEEDPFLCYNIVKEKSIQH